MDLKLGIPKKNEMKLDKERTLHEKYPVYRITHEGKTNLCQYFTHLTWIPKTHKILFQSDMSGTYELYWYDVSTQEICKISKNARVIPLNFAIAKDGSFILYRGGRDANEYRKITLFSYDDTLILKRPKQYHEWDAGILEISADGKRFYTCCHKEPSRIPSNIFSGDIENGTFQPLLQKEIQDTCYIDHQMLCPINPNLMQFNLTPKERKGKETKQRMWLLDLKTKKYHPLYKHKRKLFSLERVGHEAWMPDGYHLTFVVRRDKIKICDLGGNLNDSHGNEHDWIACQGPNYWHACASPSGNLIIADTMWHDTGLWLNEVVPNNKGRIFQLCLTNSRWQDVNQNYFEPNQLPLLAHPHPGWSGDGKYVHFTANDFKFNNASQIFIVPVAKFNFS